MTKLKLRITVDTYQTEEVMESETVELEAFVMPLLASRNQVITGLEVAVRRYLNRELFALVNPMDSLGYTGKGEKRE